MKYLDTNMIIYAIENNSKYEREYIKNKKRKSKIKNKKIKFSSSLLRLLQLFLAFLLEVLSVQLKAQQK